MKTGFNIREGSQMIHDRAVALGTLPRPSQAKRILAVLADGKLHTTAEIHERAGSSRLNSRIAELRKRGYNIAYEFVGGVGPEAHAYRLICTEDTTSGGHSDSAAAPPPGGADPSVQTLFGAAA